MLHIVCFAFVSPLKIMFHLNAPCLIPTEAEHGLVSRIAAVIRACNHLSPSVMICHALSAARSVVTQCVTFVADVWF